MLIEAMRKMTLSTWRRAAKECVDKEAVATLKTAQL